MRRIWRLLLRGGWRSLSWRRKPQDGTAGAVLVNEDLEGLEVHKNRSAWFQRSEHRPVNYSERD